MSSPELWEKCEIPSLLRDFQAQWESPLFGLFHGAAFSIAHLPTNCAIEPDLETFPIMADELVVIMSPEHALASKETLHIGDLGSESIIIEGDSSSLHETIVEAFRRLQTPLHVP